MLPRLFLSTLTAALIVGGCSQSDDATSDETTTTTVAPATTTAPTTTTTTAPITTTDAVDAIPLRLTFNGESCTYEGTTELTPGPIELVFLNESEGSAAVNMVSIDEGHTIQDLIDDLGPEPSTGHHPS